MIKVRHAQGHDRVVDVPDALYAKHPDWFVPVVDEVSSAPVGVDFDYDPDGVFTLEGE